VNQLEQSDPDYASVSEGMFSNLEDFRRGTEIIMSHMPLPVVTRTVVKKQLSSEPY
jgi:hypothetical protein